MEIQWDIALPPLTVIGAMLPMWWRLDQKIEGVRKASEDAHKSIRGDLGDLRDDVCDLKVTSAAISTDIEWIKKELARD